jgi:small-conductance mechanosensitive channel
MDTQSVSELLQPMMELFDDHPYLKAAAIFLISLAIAKLIAFIVVNVLGKLAHRTDNRLDDRLAATLHRPLFWSVVLIGLLISVNTMQLPEVVTTINRGLILSLLAIIWSSIIVRLLRILTGAMSNNAKAHSLIRPQTLPLFNNIGLIIVIALASYFIFHIWNIDMTAWVASAGVAGIAIGFAAKDTLANLFSGVFILADAPYKIGDYVVLETGERGKVTHIGIRSTRLLTRDDVEITIPNSIMGNTRIVNESGGPHEKFRIKVAVGVAYGSDIDKVRQILHDIAIEEQEVCTDPEPRVRFIAFGASSLDFALQCWVENPELRGSVLDSLNTTIYKRFMSEDIEIPYSKHDVYIKEMPKS